MVRKDITKPNLLKALSALENGSHLGIPGVELIPVDAFRLVPAQDVGYMTIDGESIPIGPIQAQIMPTVINIFVK